MITSAPTNIGYQTSFQVGTPQANSIARVALLRCGSITHGFNTDQRYVGLTFSATDGDTLSVAAPPNGRVAPPGYYMLWLIDEAGRPCERASFVRVSQQKLVLSADISTFSIHEVDALGTPARSAAPSTSSPTGSSPPRSPHRRIDLLCQNNDEVPGISLTVGPTKYEAGSTAADIAQRIVYPVHVTFTSTAASTTFPPATTSARCTLYARIGTSSASSSCELSKNPNPRMSDGDPPWLSIDLRVFKTNPGDAPSAEIEHPDDGADGAYSYIQDVLTALNDWDGAGHPFDALPTDQDVNRLELATNDVDDNPVVQLCHRPCALPRS